MQIIISGHGIKVTPALRDYAQKKVEKLEEFFNNIQKADLVLDARKIDDIERSQVAELTIWIAGLRVVRATEAGRDMYAAIDMVYDEAKRQIIKHKDKLKNERRHEAAMAKPKNQPVKPEREPLPKLQKVRRFADKPLTIEDAQAKLSDLKQDFLVFMNSDTHKTCVIFKNHQNEIEHLDPDQHELVAMLPDEAAAVMTKKNRNFHVFINPSNKKVNVLFKRKAGNFGLIEPEF